MSITFTTRIAPHIRVELTCASKARREARFDEEFAHLEAAHVLGQESTFWHVRIHVAMGQWAWRRRDWREFLGQIVRVLGAATKTFLGLVPRGNTGDVSLFKSLPVSLEHEILIQKAKSENGSEP